MGVIRFNDLQPFLEAAEGEKLFYDLKEWKYNDMHIVGVELFYIKNCFIYSYYKQFSVDLQDIEERKAKEIENIGKKRWKLEDYESKVKKITEKYKSMKDKEREKLRLEATKLLTDLERKFTLIRASYEFPQGDGQ